MNHTLYGSINGLCGVAIRFMDVKTNSPMFYKVATRFAEVKTDSAKL